jgi:hypothetical protein
MNKRSELGLTGWKNKQELKYRSMESKIDDELTYKIIGCAMKVHNTLGNGFQAVIYQRCLAISKALILKILKSG